MLTKGRNISIDYLRMVLIFLVVLAHSDISTYGICGWLVSDGLARVTVPIFLIINGYYFADIVDDKQKVKKYLKQILIIYITWTIIYLPFLWYMSGGGKKLILINFITGYYHLWYIASLIGAAILIFLTRKCKLTYVLIASFICFFIGYVIQKIYVFDVHIYMYPTIVRTFLFMGFPFMFSGYYIKKMNLEERPFFKSNYVVLLSTVLFALLILESVLLYYNFKVGELDPVKDEIYLVSPFVAPLIFLSVLKFSKYELGGDNYIAKVTASIYYVHVVAIFLVNGSPYNADAIMFPISFLLSMIFAAAIIELNKRVRIFL
ncbi:acyltransferase family protein [Dysgonomonas sp. Marseille-P4361]|uniref:acyltransferase family protein n=1 Tax=Dysgonomonas sp. Marseille-P4361 TaxID=2161820 RepID=UPI000D54BF09|nr:acyltransferase family protein [Dysgonomonas sp. Marseille-P4361]